MLEARSVTKSYASNRANDGVNLRVAVGEVLALVGENGAGKSTLVKILSGVLVPDSGSVCIDGRTVLFHSTSQAVAAGVAAVHQHFALVPSLTGLENIRLALAGDMKRVAARAREAAAKAGLRIPLDQPIHKLPVPLQQQTEILRALVQDCRYLLLDEPTASLGPHEAAAVRCLARDLAASGHAVVIVTHRLTDVMDCADRVTVMRRGRVVAGWPVSETDVERISEAMVGQIDLSTHCEIPEMPPGEVVLDVRDVRCVRDAGGIGLDGISLSVRAGEVLGVAGVTGSGQELLTEIVSGMRFPRSGRVLLSGRDVTRLSPAERSRLGLSHVPADRRRYGLVERFTVQSNLCLRRYRESRLSPHGWVRRAAWRELAQSLRKRMEADWPLELQVRHLSGGNMQRLILIREMEAGSRVLLAVYPTRGLDVRAAEQTRELIRVSRTVGRSVLLISEDLQELLDLSDRIVVLSSGRITGTVERGEATAALLGQLLGGTTKGEAP